MHTAWGRPRPSSRPGAGAPYASGLRISLSPLSALLAIGALALGLVFVVAGARGDRAMKSRAELPTTVHLPQKIAYARV